MNTKNNMVINGHIIGIIGCTILGIAAVALDLANLYWVALILFACIYTDSVRRYKTEEHGHKQIRKALKMCIGVLVIFAILGLLNTYMEWLDANSLFRIFKVCAVVLFPIEAVYLAKIKNN